MGRTRYSGPIKSTGGFEVGAAAEGLTPETNTEVISPDGVINNSVVVASGATLTVTKALHANTKVIAFGTATGTTVTLPAATGTGNKYTFVIATTATSNANIIKVANATDVMNGSLNLQQDDDSDGTSKTWMAEVGDDTMTFAGAATTGGIVGNRIEVIDYAAGFFTCTAWTISSGGSEVTPFSATVS